MFGGTEFEGMVPFGVPLPDGVPVGFDGVLGVAGAVGRLLGPKPVK